jgi:hypothetical protein
MVSFPTWMRRILAVLLTLIALSACSKSSEQPDDKATAQLSGYNHTADYIHQFYVDDAWGGNVFAYSGGGGFVCCIVYPLAWREGLTAKVRWTTSSSDPNATGAAAEGQWHEAIVLIERYKEPGTTLNVHFLGDGKVRLIITNGTDEAPGYPGPRLPPKPKDFKW